MLQRALCAAMAAWLWQAEPVFAAQGCPRITDFSCLFSSPPPAADSHPPGAAPRLAAAQVPALDLPDGCFV